jgi:hypothetical protein
MLAGEDLMFKNLSLIGAIVVAVSLLPSCDEPQDEDAVDLEESLTIPAPPDLRVTHLSTVITPTPFGFGATVEFSVKNIGGFPAFDASYSTVSGASETIPGEEQVGQVQYGSGILGDLAPGEAKTISVKCPSTAKPYWQCNYVTASAGCTNEPASLLANNEDSWSP